jgi:hypothetical protein
MGSTSKRRRSGSRESARYEELELVARSNREALHYYRIAVARGRPQESQRNRAREAYLNLGGNPDRVVYSLKDYAHQRWGPFLGVSDEGSAAAAILSAALESPKARAFPKRRKPEPLNLGLALDAERLGGIGEVVVGPEEYADIWLGTVDRLFVTTNIGTRVNTRVYKREPTILLKADSNEAIEKAKSAITDAFRPFVKTPDGTPRPLCVFVDIPRYAKMTTTRKRSLLRKLNSFVMSGEAAGLKRVPRGQRLGLSVWVKLGLAGKAEVQEAIDLAAGAELGIVRIDGVKRKEADAAISFAGMLDYFAPGIVGPLLRAAARKKVQLRPANLPDADTIARSIWSGLTTARHMGAHLGKYGCFPLTLMEMDRVVELIQGWFPDWSAAPVFFVDQGLLSDRGIDVGNDLTRGLRTWLEMVASHNVEIVLIDTVDKGTGRRILKKNSRDKNGYLTMGQIVAIEEYARKLGIRALWAGGLDMRGAFEMGKLGVFGIYVTSAAASSLAVNELYSREPGLAAMKEPTREGVLTAKTLLEAGFLSTRVSTLVASRLSKAAQDALRIMESESKAGLAESEAALTSACIDAWKNYWSKH